jgi:membrane protease YdiL (CAAX protease family)
LNKKNEGVMERRSLCIFWPILLIPAIIVVVLGVAGFEVVASTTIFMFHFAGFGEEILFRGYFQSRLNEDFGRPWRTK